MEIFSPLRENTSSSNRAANCCADGRAFPATCYRSNDRADSGTGSNFRDIVLGSALASDTALAIHLASLVGVSRIQNLNHLCAQTRAATVRRPYTFEREL